MQVELPFNKGCGFINYLRSYFYQSEQLSTFPIILRVRTSVYEVVEVSDVSAREPQEAEPLSGSVVLQQTASPGADMVSQGGTPHFTGTPNGVFQGSVKAQGGI